MPQLIGYCGKTTISLLHVSVLLSQFATGSGTGLLGSLVAKSPAAQGLGVEDSTVENITGLVWEIALEEGTTAAKHEVEKTQVICSQLAKLGLQSVFGCSGEHPAVPNFSNQ